jgi:OOP family OmpA-OmpF porin
MKSVGSLMRWGVAGCALLSTALMSTTALASDRHGWYVGLDVGWSNINDTKVEGTPNNYDFDNGYGVLGTVGFAFHNHLRLEAEAGYRKNEVDAMNGVSATNGDLKEITGFFNLLYDLTSPASPWRLSVGAGVGVDNARFRDHTGFESRDTVLSGQGLLGLTYELGPHTELALNYRYLWNDQATLATTVGLAHPEGKVELDKHLLSIGLRYGFDDPPPPPAAPPPPPPPPPPMAKQFVIFFGFNKCNITAEADAVLSEAAASAKSSGSASVRIVGHTDTVGSNDYNQKLSDCRANAAKTNLVAKGVPEGAISASGKGESELMVQTGDGVKEPQNRRATVDLN